MTLTTRIPTALALLSLLTFAAACDRDERAGAARAGGRPVRPASLDPRSQYDLASDLTRVENERNLHARASGYDQVRSSWTGKRYHWRVRVLEPLCRAQESCNVLPFDRAGKDRHIVHGWMPRLDLDPAAFAAIRRTCGKHTDCAIEMEGTLARFTLDTEQPTSLEFRDVVLPVAGTL